MTSELSIHDFPAFFEAATGHPPFPWQERLARQVDQDGWPAGLDLPTASGKTACIEIGVFTLALQADRASGDRTAPRRIFFVVDRRIVVDAAFDRASALARNLREAKSGILKEVADRLRAMGGEGLPLGVERLRGGMRRENAWTRSPAQAAVITCTVDQIGSRLLFRSYDGSRYMAPVHAGLAGNDALILLDEAHCSLPFLQTAAAVDLFRSERWSERPPLTPFRFVVLSATLPSEAGPAFKLVDADRTHPVLKSRIEAAKPTELHVAKKARVGRDPSPADRKAATAALAEELVDHAVRLRSDGRTRIAVMANRVATVEAVAERLRRRVDSATADVILMTGRMRPLDRDTLTAAWAPRLRASDPEDLNRPVFVVATQTLEVGADFDFDVLVTECASLDALRQRFGRLDRLGRGQDPRGVIVVRKDQEKKSEDDPIYGAALAATWEWLKEQADDGVVDMGIAAVEERLSHGMEREELLGRLEAPKYDAPVMLPAHVDRWVQTDPIPRPDPEPAIFLHGSERSSPEVHVIWRADLTAPDGASEASLRASWTAAVSLCPPTSVEAITVPIYFLKRWMREQPTDPEGALGDVDGVRPAEGRSEGRSVAGRPVLLWRGRTESMVTADPERVRPGDFVVIPATSGGHESFGHIPPDQEGGVRLDVADEAFQVSRDRVILRATPSVVAAWPDVPATSRVQAWITGSGGPPDEAELDDILRDLAMEQAVTDQSPWLHRAAENLRSTRRRKIVDHPAGGYAVIALDRLGEYTSVEHPFADADDEWSVSVEPVALGAHLEGVAARAAQLADSCGLPPDLRDDLELAARLHDAGKADDRFQLMLHGGSEIRRARAESALAKSDGMPETGAAYLRVRERSSLPTGFRHELVSVRLAESAPEMLSNAHDPDLVLHLIASHHGRCRPFAPVVPDPAPIRVEYPLNGHLLQCRSETGLERLDSGVAERFWSLVRRYGWWGLSYLEAVLRLADHRESELETVSPREGRNA